MDVRWLAYVGSGLLAAVSLVPVAVFHPAATPPPAARPAAPRELARQASLPAMLDVTHHTEQLQAFHSAPPEPRTPIRNPFRYVGQPSDAANRIVAADAAPASAVPSATDDAPALRLVGMADRQVDDSTVRYAIVSGVGDVYLVTAGDHVANRFTVVAVGADAVELRDDDAGTTVRLGLGAR